jgi:hypothetical protein
MLHLLDATFEAFLRAEVPLDDQIDVAYEAPDNEWSSGINRPTVNLFVWDIRRNHTEAFGGMDLVEREQDRFHRPVPPRIDFRYLVTTWTQDVRDEHALLGAVLVACLRLPQIPQEHLQGALAEVAPLPRIQVARFDQSESSEFWSSMGGQLKAALDVVITATVDTAVMRKAGPPVRSIALGSTSLRDPGSRSERGQVFPEAASNGGAR